MADAAIEAFARVAVVTAKLDKGLRRICIRTIDACAGEGPDKCVVFRRQGMEEVDRPVA